MRTTFALALLALAAAAPQQAPGKHKLLPGQGIDWKGDWDAAVLEATARNVPILFTVHKDN
jgi:hypothetical protein